MIKEQKIKIRESILNSSIYQGVENFKSRANMEIDKTKTMAEDGYNNAKTRIRIVQTFSVTQLIQAQIKTDTWLRQLADKLTHPKTSGLQDKLINFSDKWMDFTIENYESLNAKIAVRELKDLSLTDLLRAKHFEGENKNRKTVLDAINKKLEKYEAGLV